VFCFFTTTISAEHLTQSSNVTISQSVSNIFSSQLSSEDLTSLKDASLYESGHVPISIDNQPIMKIYNEIYWACSNTNLNEILLYAEQSNVFDYVAFNENVRLRKIVSKELISIGFSPEKSSLNYTNDIKEMSSNFEIFGRQCQILNIYCFDGFSSHQGASIYFVTDQGTYIKHYENKHSNGIWFEEEQYKKYADEYYNYLISQENNYTENGEPIGGGNLSFISFINKSNNSSGTIVNKPENNTEQNSNTENNHKQLEQIVLACVVISLITLSIIIFSIFRKKAKK